MIILRLFILTIFVLLSLRTAAIELLVLGVTQDAGYPMATCYRPHCIPGWQDHTKRLTPASVAVINLKQRSKLLFDATPALPEQLYQLEQVAPSDIFKLDGVFLTHAQIGHYTGLIYFGNQAINSHKLPVYAMPKMAKLLTENSPWSELVSQRNISLKPLVAEQMVEVKGMKITPFQVPYNSNLSETIGYLIEGTNKKALYIPDIDKWALWNKRLVEQVAAVDYALISGVYYDTNETPGRSQTSVRSPFVTETMALFSDAPLSEKAKIHFIHMNHTNPLLKPNSEQTKTVLDAGFNIARPGMRLGL